MKSFKHIVSYACDKNCSYCINEILVHDEKQCKDSWKIHEAYVERALDGYNHVMISGGEPVLNKMFETCIKKASTIFDHVSIITAHNKALSHELINQYADDVLFSFHAEYMNHVYDKIVEIDTPFYGSMVVEAYQLLEQRAENPLDYLKHKGFDGATIRECYPDGDPLPEDFNVPDNFSLRTHKKDNCVKESILMLPDLTLTTEQEFS